MKNNDEMVLDTDEAAAKQETVTVWKSRTGKMYLDEAAARYDGCTHRPCNACGKPAHKRYTLCDECREKVAIERYEALEHKEWDGATPLYSRAADRYFFSRDELTDYLTDNEGDAKSLRLVFCQPEFLTEIDPNDYYESILPEEGRVDKVIESVFEALNEAIRAHREPVAWSPGRIAAEVTL